MFKIFKKWLLSQVLSQKKLDENSFFLIWEFLTLNSGHPFAQASFSIAIFSNFSVSLQNNFIIKYNKINDAYKMIGNAVPVKLAEAIAKEVRISLTN